MNLSSASKRKMQSELQRYLSARSFEMPNFSILPQPYNDIDYLRRSWFSDTQELITELDIFQPSRYLYKGPLTLGFHNRQLGPHFHAFDFRVDALRHSIADYDGHKHDAILKEIAKKMADARWRWYSTNITPKESDIESTIVELRRNNASSGGIFIDSDYIALSPCATWVELPRPNPVIAMEF